MVRLNDARSSLFQFATVLFLFATVLLPPYSIEVVAARALQNNQVEQTCFFPFPVTDLLVYPQKTQVSVHGDLFRPR